MRAAWLLALLCACGSHESAAPPATTGVTDSCRATAAKLGDVPLDARVKTLLDACQVCGPWQPILEWRTLQTAGGPTRAAIEQAMLGCTAFCDPTAKERFLGTLDEARGKSSRGPWRHLADVCKGAVSAVPDARYASATMFALDRIARAASPIAADLPLPALSLSGVGVDLPRSPAALPTAPRAQLTIIGDEAHVGLLPIAHLTAAGVVTDYGSDVYPGAVAADPGAALGSASDVVILAPAKLPASRVTDVVAKLHAAHVLLGAAIDAPDGWELVGTMPRPLNGVTAGSGATVQDLADQLAAQH
jgi:hypothetical protein